MTMPLTVDVTIDAPEWAGLLPDAEPLAVEAARAAWLAASGLDGRASEVSVLLTDDETGRALNKRHRGQDRPTNVLSFPIGDAISVVDRPAMLGDVVLACGVVAREAEVQGKPVAAHFRHLVVHGVLHLLGHDHESDRDAESMESLEVEILENLSVPNPYRCREAAE